MSLSHFNKEEQALIIYFKQMLDKYDDTPPAAAASGADAAPQPGGPQPSPQPQLQQAPEVRESPRPVAYAGKSLETLLEAVEPHTGTAQLEEKAPAEVQAEVQEAQAAEPETVQAEEVQEEVTAEVQEEVQEEQTEVQAEVQTAAAEQAEAQAEPETVQAEAQAEQKQEQQAKNAEISAEEAARKAEDESLRWSNIETDAEFQALFFIVKGVRFAVPLVDLGGIFAIDKPLTELFGKPAWYRGMMDLKGKNINVVDTIRWVKPDAPEKNDYKYMIVLGNSLWSVGCDELEGNRFLKKDSVKWRQNAGGRPWLAGIVKEEMCALLHVKALIAMFEKGFELNEIVS